MQATLQVGVRHPGHGPGLDHDGRRNDLVGWEHAPRTVGAPRDRDSDRRVPVRPVQAIGGEQRRDAVRDGSIEVGGKVDVEALRGSMEAGEMLR